MGQTKINVRGAGGPRRSAVVSALAIGAAGGCLLFAGLAAGQAPTTPPATPPVTMPTTPPATMPATDLIGTWSGKVAGITPPQTLTIEVSAVAIDNDAGKLHFGGARACELELEYAGDDADHFFFITKRPTGGYCRQLDFGSLDVLFAAEPDTIAFTLSKRDNTVTDTGTAKRTAP